MSDMLVLEVAARLESLGVRGKALDRVLAEMRGHLEDAQRAGDDDPAASFGDPREFAREVAAQLATSRTRRAALTSFGALAVVGTAYTAMFALVPAAGGWADIFGGHVQALGPVLGAAAVLFPQIAFVSGCLALLQAFRIRENDVVVHAELALLRRRSTIALGAGAAALVALAGTALDFEATMAAWWTWLALATSATLLPFVGASAYIVSDSACPAAVPGGSAGDLFDDLDFLLGRVLRRRSRAPLRLREHPWRFAGACAIGVGLAAFLAGWYAEGDPGSGVVRGAFEAFALIFCFAALGRFLGLRRKRS
jgi:hypothetical protein